MSYILGIAGSLREASFNKALLRAAVSLHPGAIQAAGIEGIPLYNADVESAGFPAVVEHLKQRVAAAKGVLLVSPEYNNSIPGVFKNAVDWLSRPSGDIRNVFHEKPVAVIGASPGRFGTILAQNAWLPVLRTLGARHWAGGRLMVSDARTVVDGDGNLADEDLRVRFDRFLRGFIDFCDGSTA